MKLKDLMEKYGEYEINDFNIEEAFTELNTNEDCCGICIKVKKPKPKTVWDLEKGDEYFYCYGNEVYKAYWGNSEYYDLLRISVGDIFLTKEEARQEIERRKVETLLLKHGGRRWFKKDGYNYYMWVNTWDSLVIHSSGVRMQGVIYFDTDEQARKAIAEIGEERIKKALFEVI